MRKTSANDYKQFTSYPVFDTYADSKVDSKRPEKLLSLVILYEQPASLNVLKRTPANIRGQAGQMVHIPLFGSVGAGVGTA